MLPSGLVEYLKFKAITEDHRKNLDDMEDEFYATFSGTKSTAGSSSVRQSTASGAKKATKINDLQLRMRKRITSVLKEQFIEKLSPKPAGSPAEVQQPLQPPQPMHDPLGGNLFPSGQSNGLGAHQGGSYPGTNPPTLATVPTPPPAPKTIMVPTNIPPTGAHENYRIMFHVLTQDHKLPDLIWNEQTRLELRSTLEAEIKEFEREQRLRGIGKIAWNYQQFFVKYESLKDELQVGPIYVR